MTAPAAPPRRPPAPDAATLDNVAHLWRRAGFGAGPARLVTVARDGLDSAIAALVDYDATPDPFDPPQDIINSTSRNPTNLTQWWLGRMLATERPLQEKMVLFWHGHFATGIGKVANPVLMFNQNQLFRDNALGRFDDMLSAVYKDPAMLIWLDGRRNTAQAPNENYGREVMELFTLGHGNYSEDDVHANARAYTGWTLDASGNSIFRPRLHDAGVKTLLGQTGNWSADDSVRILAAHPATGPFLAGRLWAFFASDTLPGAAVNRMSKVYYSSNHSIREMVRTMFTAPEFYSGTTRSGHIKSPTEFVVTALNSLGLGTADLSPYPRALAAMGQELFNPPNVGGWPGGATWTNPTTMLQRFNVASTISGEARKAGGPLDPTTLLTASKAKTMTELTSYISGTLGINPTGATARALKQFAGTGSVDRPDIAARIQGLVHLVLISPEYQVS
jgi:uncharacterized protein (DUF1800 family)